MTREGRSAGERDGLTRKRQKKQGTDGLTLKGAATISSSSSSSTSTPRIGIGNCRVESFGVTAEASQKSTQSRRRQAIRQLTYDKIITIGKKRQFHDRHSKGRYTRRGYTQKKKKRKKQGGVFTTCVHAYATCSNETYPPGAAGRRPPVCGPWPSPPWLRLAQTRTGPAARARRGETATTS